MPDWIRPSLAAGSSGTFFPINGRLFGNENGGVNGNFTLQANTSFSYAPGQYFSFTGDDDVWVYINDKLVIDLGGVHGSYSAQVYLDNLGLTPGQNYPMAIFSAERDIGGSDFAATTNIPFGLSDTYTYNSQAVDPNPAYTPNLNYSIVTAPAGATIDPSSGEVDWIPGGNGTFPFTIKATDPLGLSGTQSWSVNVTGVSTNHPPTVVSPAALPAANASVGRLYEAMVDKNFSDSDGDTLHYSAVGNWPAGMTVGDTGNIEWTPTATEINNGTPYQLQVQASDARGGTATLSFPISVGYLAAGAPYAVSATNNNNGTATFTWANSPESDVLGYNVYRTSSAGGAAVLLNQSGLVQRTINQLPSWTDTLPTPTATTTYLYYATAVSNTDGHLLESVPSTSFSVTVQGTGSGQPGVLQIVQAASASPTPVTGTTTTLSVLAKEGTDDTGLTYTWTAIDNPPSQPTYSDNGDNAAKNTTATFTAAGTYTFNVTVSDASGQTATSAVTVVVDQTATSIGISPTSVTISLSVAGQAPSTQQFTAVLNDQFGDPISGSQAFVWSRTGDGSIDQNSGLYTAPESGNGATIVANADGLQSNSVSLLLGSTPLSISFDVSSTADIEVNWNYDPNVDSYVIYRSTDPNFVADGSNAITVADDGVGSYVDDSLAANTQYFYEIDAVGADGMSSTEVGRGNATTLASDGPLVGGIENNAGGAQANGTGASRQQPTPSGVAVQGVNDTTVYVSWHNHALNATNNVVQESDGAGGWTQVASVPANVHGCMIRNLQTTAQYTFRVIAANAYAGSGSGASSIPSPSASGGPVRATFNNMIYLIGGHLQTESDLEGSVDGEKAYGVGAIFWDLVGSGYNPYLTAEGSSTGFAANLLGVNWGGVVNWNGTGEAEQDIGNEWTNGDTTAGDPITAVGLIGYSHGASIAEHMSSRLLGDESISTADQVVFGGSIDSVQRYEADWPAATGDGPDDLSPADQAFDWAAAAINYWQPNSYPFTAPSLNFNGKFQIHGVAMGGIPSYDNIEVPFQGGGTSGKVQSHVSIDQDPFVLLGMESSIGNVWGPVVNRHPVLYGGYSH